MRASKILLDLVSKNEINKMKISISSRQVRASNMILDLVSKNCTFFHISHDILKSSYMMLHNIFSEAVDGTPTKESVAISGYIFNLCHSVNLSHRDSTGEKPQPCLAILWKSKVQGVLQGDSLHPRYTWVR